MNIFYILRPHPEMRRCFQYNFVLVGLGKDCGHKPLPQGIVQGIVDIGHCEAKTRCRIAIYIQPRHSAGHGIIAGHMDKLLSFFKEGNDLWNPFRQLFAIQRFNGKLILCARDPVLNREILHWLNIEGKPRQMRRSRHQSFGNGRRPLVPVCQGNQGNSKT